jgi:hypothetical protein
MSKAPKAVYTETYEYMLTSNFTTIHKKDNAIIDLTLTNGIDIYENHILDILEMQSQGDNDKDYQRCSQER